MKQETHRKHEIQKQTHWRQERRLQGRRNMQRMTLTQKDEEILTKKEQARNEERTLKEQEEIRKIRKWRQERRLQGSRDTTSMTCTPKKEESRKEHKGDSQ